MKWLAILVFGVLLLFIAVLTALSASLFVHDQKHPRQTLSAGMAGIEGSSRPPQFASRPNDPMFNRHDLQPQLKNSISGIQYEKQSRERSALVNEFYELGAENVWAQKELQPLQLYIQLPDDATMRQAIMDRVAAECACGSLASHHHVVVGDRLVVVVLNSTE